MKKLFMVDDDFLVYIQTNGSATIEYVLLSIEDNRIIASGVFEVPVIEEQYQQLPISLNAVMAAINECGLIGFAIAEVPMNMLEKPQFGKLWFIAKEEAVEPVIRIVDETYKDKFLLKDGANVSLDTLKDTMTGHCQYIDPYHFRFCDDVYHICQFGEMCKRIAATVRPEAIITDDCAAWKIERKGYIAIQRTEGASYDYTLYNSDYTDFDGGILDEPEWNMCEARDAILKDFDWDGRLMTLIDYDELMEHV